MRSLRYRIPAVFLLGVLVAAIVAAVLAVRLFQDYTRDRTLGELRRQAQGLAQLYQEQAIRSVDEARRAPGFAAPILEQATGSQIYYAGVERSEERRVGKECALLCRSRWSPYH